MSKAALPLEGSSFAPGKAVWLLIGVGAVLASMIATVLSLAFVSFVSLTKTYDVGIYLASASLAGLLTGLPIWWRFIGRPRYATVGRGVLLGALSSIVAHPLMWGFEALFSSLLGADPTRTLGLIVFMDIPLSLMSLFYVGWITTLVGGATGGVLMYLQRTLALRSQQRADSRGRGSHDVAAPVEP
jgi:hypothetical protein